MNIKGVAVKIVKGKKSPGAVVLDKAMLGRMDIYSNERNVRDVCLAALKKAKRTCKKRIIFFVSDEAAIVFPPIATAKIMAQEIYRHIKEDKTTLKEIDIVLSCERTFQIFDKTIRGYLTHLLEVLTQGPFVTVDTIIEANKGIVLIKRSNPPFGWAIPGGFVDYGESLEEAAAREAFEETGLRVKNLKQMQTYSKPGRDPRFHTITTVFVCQANGTPHAASDAQEAEVFAPGAWRNIPLAFDHRKVLTNYLLNRNS